MKHLEKFTWNSCVRKTGTAVPNAGRSFKGAEGGFRAASGFMKNQLTFHS
jgi:hypothetical protein